MHVLQLRKNTTVSREELQVGEKWINVLPKINLTLNPMYVISSMDPNMTMIFTT